MLGQYIETSRSAYPHRLSSFGCSFINEYYIEVTKMSAGIDIAKNDNELRIKITGKFDFDIRKGFLQAYTGEKGNFRQYVVDMKTVTYIDSSALGMLLQMREYLGENENNLSIENCNETVQQILKIGGGIKHLVLSSRRDHAAKRLCNRQFNKTLPVMVRIS